MLQRELSAKKPNIDELKSHFKRMIVQSVVDASGKNTAFMQVLERNELNDSFCVAIDRELERELRQRLGVDEKNVSLYKLIMQAGDANILSPDAVDLAVRTPGVWP
ncbi:hypothetical protein [Kallotenue papyrolyticum]|uniref:hypothetical protein n=1 Tax=Kallotenue papyrolyticum TaxID=1325125 RepID=UPI0012686A5E|nr:hypothetical protein [Kallotenue papyrolyticum]